MVAATMRGWMCVLVCAWWTAAEDHARVMEMELNGNLAEDNSSNVMGAHKRKLETRPSPPPLILIAIQHTSPCCHRTFTVTRDSKQKNTRTAKIIIIHTHTCIRYLYTTLTLAHNTYVRIYVWEFIFATRQKCVLFFFLSPSLSLSPHLSLSSLFTHTVNISFQKINNNKW